MLLPLKSVALPPSASRSRSPAKYVCLAALRVLCVFGSVRKYVHLKMEDKLTLEEWDESHVSSWLKSIHIKNEYIQRLFNEEVTGPALKEINEEFLKKIGMKEGQIQLLIKKRNELVLQCTYKNTGVGSESIVQLVSKVPHDSESHNRSAVGKDAASSVLNYATAMDKSHNNTTDNQSTTQKSVSDSESDIQEYQKVSMKKEKLQSTKEGISNVEENLGAFHPFKREVLHFTYVKNRILPPETGIIDLITPCHEYKSFATASGLDRTRIQAKFAYEVLRFGSACMNVRTNGTIHFGVMDSVENKGWKHGQIVGIPVYEKDIYVDALDYIEKCFKSSSDQNAARLCIHPPKFIQVINKESQEQSFVIEVDIEPLFDIVKRKVFQVCLPKFNENSNKVSHEKRTIYQRIGTKSEPVKEEENVAFIQELQEKDARRKQAESKSTCIVEAQEDLGRKLSVLLTNGKKYMDDTLWYILVTNKCEKKDLQNITFLMCMKKIFCVFDFDADSELSGLCLKYKDHHATILHSPKSYTNESGMSTSELKKHLNLFAQTSWIFCNGRSNYPGDDEYCDENTWVKNKKKHLKKAVSFICNEILPKGSFIVLFLLLSPVEKPIVDTFHEFYAEMSGMDDIICISESKENYAKWASLAQASCSLETIDHRSIVGMKLSHIDATVQNMLPFITAPSRRLPVSTKGVCVLATPEEERMFSLEILCIDECDSTKLDLLSDEKILEIESTFYRGGKVSWKNFWLADKKKCGEVIEREACSEVDKILHGILHENTVKLPVARIKIAHQPGSGGSTVARQVLWKKRKDLRCAVLKTSCPVTTVCQHAVKLREYEEKDIHQCLPVLLLVEDCDEEYIDDLKYELADAMVCKKINHSKPCFILMSCKRANDPEKLCKASPLETVAVTHKLKGDEKRLFANKAVILCRQFEPEFIITFVLMSEEFNEQYVRNFVVNVLEGIDHSSPVTRLMRYVALLNFYVQNSYISLSHCEAFLGLGAHTDDYQNCLRQYNFKACLSDQAKLIFIEITEPTTWISSIHIIHPLVAKEILQQLSGSRPQSQIAADLLEERVLLEHRFGKDDFLKFIRDLFLRRYKKSRGDSVDSFFSPLIEHICDTEKNCDKAIDLLKAAYERFGKDPFFAQQLARLNYSHEKFDDAKKWAEQAKLHSPDDLYILHTEGLVYSKWFNVLIDKKKGEHKSEEVFKLIQLALKAMECFRASENAAKSDLDSINTSAYFSEVDVGCRLLKLLSSLEVFQSNKESENVKLMRYLLTDYVPEEIFKPWTKFHSHLKGLYDNIYRALEYISEDLSYFQIDKNEDDQPHKKSEEQIYSPRKWLARKTEAFAKFFCSKHLLNDDSVELKNPALVSQLVRHMNIYRHGGGSVTTILSLLSDFKDERSAVKLEEIISLYPKDVQKESLEDFELVNYILCHIALCCVSPNSHKMLSFQKLRHLSSRWFRHRRTYPPSAYLLLSLLYWPDDLEDLEPSQEKDDILTLALQTMRRLHEIKIKNIPVRKKRTNVLFFLSKGSGIHKIVHRSKIEKLIEGPLNERQMKWQNEELLKMHKVHKVLKPVLGWTEDGKVFACGHCEKTKIRILPLNISSVPQGNEKVTFYLGFSFNGLVAYNIQVAKLERTLKHL
ncbi:sterile alpha motif domain-containing protein 9-like isoform X3 [Lissotriton helveticus]